MLISTHDVEFAAAASRRTLLMADGELIADGSTAEVLTSSPAYAPQMAKVFAPLPVMRMRVECMSAAPPNAPHAPSDRRGTGSAGPPAVPP